MATALVGFYTKLNTVGPLPLQLPLKPSSLLRCTGLGNTPQRQLALKLLPLPSLQIGEKLPAGLERAQSRLHTKMILLPVAVAIGSVILKGNCAILEPCACRVNARSLL